MELKDLTLRVKNLLTHEECQSIIKEYEKKKILAVQEHSLITSGKKEKSTSKIVVLTDKSPNYKIIIEKIGFAISKWIEYLESQNRFHIHVLKNILNYPHSIRILKYSVGEYIKPHIDWNDFTHASVVLNLNSGYKGGKFVFMNGLFEVELEEGEALIFPADCFWVHEVTPVTEGERYSVNSFIYSLPPDIVIQTRNNLAEKKIKGILRK